MRKRFEDSHDHRRIPMSHSAFAPDHVAVVTGGASGIGLAAAVRFARFGMRVCVADLGADRLAQAGAAGAAPAPARAAKGHKPSAHVGSPAEGPPPGNPGPERFWRT